MLPLSVTPERLYDHVGLRLCGFIMQDVMKNDCELFVAQLSELHLW